MIPTLSLEKFIENLNQKKPFLPVPVNVTLEVTYGCNLNCVHCFNPTHKALPQESSTQSLLKILDQLAEAGCLSLTLSGGEIFTRPDLWQVMDHAKKIGLQLTLFTNATLITEEKVAKMRELAPALISVSVYGITRETYESVTRVKGSFDAFMRGISLLENSGLPVLFKMPVMTLNRHELEDAYAWFKERKLPFIHSVEIHPRVDGSTEPLLYRLPEEQAARLRLQYEEDSSCRISEVSSSNPKVFNCACGKKSFALTPYGEMNLCVSTYYPKYRIAEGSVAQGWKMLVDFVESFSPSSAFECPSCEFAPHCSQGAMDAFLNTGDFNACVPYFKQTAREIKKRIETGEES